MTFYGFDPIGFITIKLTTIWARCSLYHPKIRKSNRMNTPPKFNSSPLKSYRNPIGKDRLPFPPFFRSELLNFWGCNSPFFPAGPLRHLKRCLFYLQICPKRPFMWIPGFTSAVSIQLIKVRIPPFSDSASC